MQVIVEDRNDNAPVFVNTEFSTSINEVSPGLSGAGHGERYHSAECDQEAYV